MSGVSGQLRAVTLGAVLFLGASPSLGATGQLPKLGPSVSVSRLAAGGTAIVRPVQGAPVAAVELWYRAPSTGFGSAPQPAIARLAAQVVAASKPIVGDPLGKVVSDAGGRLAITVYSDSVSISASVPATAASAVVRSMTTAFFAPVVTDDGFRSAQRDVAEEASVASFDPEIVVRDAVFGQLFTGGPQHFPALGSAKDVGRLTLSDVRRFASRAFRSQNATLVISGAVDASVAAAAAAGRPSAGEGAVPEAAAPAEIAASVQPVTRDFSQPSGGYGWLGPPIADQRAATAMDFIADYLFRSDQGLVTKQVTERYRDALVVGQFITLHDPGVMFVAYAGADRSGLQALVENGFDAVRRPLPRTVFAGALEAFKYHLLSDLQTPTQLADNFGWYSVEGSPDYAPGANGENGAYFRAANSLDAEFVAGVAIKYLGKPPVVVILGPHAADEKAASQ